MDIITEIEKQTFLIDKSAACFPSVFFFIPCTSWIETNEKITNGTIRVKKRT